MVPSRRLTHACFHNALGRVSQVQMFIAFWEEIGTCLSDGRAKTCSGRCTSLPLTQSWLVDWWLWKQLSVAEQKCTDGMNQSSIPSADGPIMFPLVSLIWSSVGARIHGLTNSFIHLLNKMEAVTNWHTGLIVVVCWSWLVGVCMVSYKANRDFKSWSAQLIKWWQQ